MTGKNLTDNLYLDLGTGEKPVSDISGLRSGAYTVHFFVKDQSPVQVDNVETGRLPSLLSQFQKKKNLVKTVISPSYGFQPMEVFA